MAKLITEAYGLVSDHPNQAKVLDDHHYELVSKHRGMESYQRGRSGHRVSLDMSGGWILHHPTDSSQKTYDGNTHTELKRVLDRVHAPTKK